MSRLVKVMIFCASVAAIVLIAKLWIGSFADGARYLVEREISAATGLHAKIRGSLDVDLLPVLRLEATGLALWAEGNSEPVLLVDEIGLTVDPWLLLVGVLAIDDLEVTGAQLRLQSLGDVPKIDVDSMVAIEEEVGGIDLDFRFERVKMTRIRIEYGDAAGLSTREWVIDQITLAANTPEAAISLSADGSFEGSPFTVRGEIGAATELLRAEKPYPISLTGQLPAVGAEFEVTGHLAEPMRLSGVEADVSIVVSDISRFLPVKPGRSVAFESIRMTGKLRDSDGIFAAEDVRVEAHGAFNTRLVATGSIKDLWRLGGVEIDAKLDADSLEFLQPFSDVTLPRFDTVEVRAKISDRDGNIGVDGSVLIGEREATWLELDGSVANLATLTDVHFVLKFGVADLRHLQSLREQPFPDIGPLKGGGVLSDRKGQLGIEHLTVGGGRPGVFEIDFSGAIGDLQEIDEITVDATFEAASLGTLGALIGADWPETSPVSFEGHITGSDEKASMTGKMRFGASEIEGTASASFASGTRPNFHVRISSHDIDFDQVGLATRPQVSGSPARRFGSWWSDDAPFPLEQLRSFDADIELRVDRISMDENFRLNDLSIIVTLDDGHLVVREVAAGSQGGSLRAELQMDTHKPEPGLILSLEASDLDLGYWLQQFSSDKQSTGIVDVSVALNSHGKSPTELRANLHGSFSAVVRDGTLASDYGQAFVVNVLRVSLPALLSVGTTPETEFGCVVIEFKVDQGIAVAETLALESAEVLVVGRGQIDLGKGAFDLVLSPRARNPEVLNLSADVEVTGPLAKPVFRARQLSIPGRVVRGLFKNVLAPVDLAFRPLRGEAEKLCRDGLSPPTRSSK